MTDHEWQAYLDTLPPELSDLAQHLMERINTVLNRDRSRVLDELQHAERRMDTLAHRMSELTARLDAYEQQRAADVQAELAQFTADQLSPARRDELIGVLYNVATRVEALEQGRADRVR